MKTSKIHPEDSCLSHVCGGWIALNRPGFIFMEKEIWNEVQGYNGHYFVSNIGRVKSIGRVVNHKLKGKKTIPERILSVYVGHGGYLCVGLALNGYRTTHRVHTLIAHSFLGKTEFKAGFKDGNKENVCLSNIYYIGYRLDALTTESNCEYCGSVFYKRGKDKQSVRYCSSKCYISMKKANAMSPEENNFKVKARQILNNYLRDKKIKRPSCLICGDPKTDAHHHDYAKPLDVKWYCRKHHSELHHAS